jgi:hypothetical protein
MENCLSCGNYFSAGWNQKFQRPSLYCNVCELKEQLESAEIENQITEKTFKILQIILKNEDTFQEEIESILFSIGMENMVILKGIFLKIRANESSCLIYSLVYLNWIKKSNPNLIKEKDFFLLFDQIDTKMPNFEYLRNSFKYFFYRWT